MSKFLTFLNLKNQNLFASWLYECVVAVQPQTRQASGSTYEARGAHTLILAGKASF